MHVPHRLEYVIECSVHTGKQYTRCSRSEAVYSTPFYGVHGDGVHDASQPVAAGTGASLIYALFVCQGD